MNQTWNTNLYDNKHAYVFQYGEEVVDLLSPKKNEKILDIGCGTGYLTHKIAQSGAHVIGIDNSKEMIYKAKSLFPSILFDLKDARDYEYEEQFDGIFSNATLHWIFEKERVITQMYNCLKKNGRLAVEFGGKGNIQNIITALKNVFLAEGLKENAAIDFFYFPSLGEYTSLLEKIGFRIIFASHFDRETQLFDKENGVKEWLQMFGSQFFVGLSEDQITLILDKTQELVRSTNYKNGFWYADYVRLRISAIKI